MIRPSRLYHISTNRSPVIVRPIRTWSTPISSRFRPKPFWAIQRQKEIAQQKTATIYDTPYLIDETTPIEIHNPLEVSGEVPSLFGTKEEEEHLIENLTSSQETSGPILAEAIQTSTEDPEQHTATPKTSTAFPRQAQIPYENISALPRQCQRRRRGRRFLRGRKRRQAIAAATTAFATPMILGSESVEKKQSSTLPWILGAAALTAILFLKK